ncbi:PstS family phosphate ABC transporter substrate-binding protein [Inmirania thermothiophila]|uniref:Phosphate ABC transporter substrate-binding protein (PhoT family) n=1 Tax=Inmirania thermothiophila TaxID=1750597 RepID=A0A3N1Y9B0_9GAMM|nr:PstS family phosphate ABC transporter substrate-binding protein [Inmirania thermothiophila]ROR35131.1 phosphate ABC transporter substrate-binding protein (PhoT family) [Inmirania thermothiophila]
MTAPSHRALGALAALALAAAALPGPAAAAELIRIDGSSTVYPITEAVAEEFQIAHRGRIRVTVGISGTGGGFKKFCRGEIDIADASRPIRPKERKACAENGVRFIELPVAFDALTVVVNPRNDWVDHLTVEELRRIWEPAAQGRILRWSQVRPGWPDVPLRLYGPGSDSGTFDYFTEAVVGEAGASRGDYTPSEDDNVLVQGVAGDRGALGYFGLAYYEENRGRLRAVPIRHGDRPPVAPSLETARNGTYQPLSRPMFIYVNAEAARRPEVRQFVEMYLDKAVAPQLVRDVGYVPLPEQAYDLALEHFRRGVTGTVFEEGSHVGIRIEELLRRERRD